MDTKLILTNEILDIALGMYVYTYPVIGKGMADVYVLRPYGFQVYEIVNGVDLENLDLDNFTGFNTDYCSDSNKYVYVVEKMNFDSYTLCRLMQKVLKCKSCEVLGLKDAKAITRQVVVLSVCSKPNKVMNMQYRRRYIKAFLWYCNPGIIIHNGNKFRVKIITKDLDLIKKNLKFVQEYNYIFLNFFGYQRFGTRRPITHLLGKLLLKNELDLFMEILCNLRTGKIIEKLEGIVCKNWFDHNDALKSVKNIPKNYILLYINAYQAYLFNLMLSKLWLKLLELYGFKEAFKKMINEYRYLPIVGSKFHVNHKPVREVLDDIMSIEDIDPSYFHVKILALEVKGDIRQALAQAQNVKTYFDYEGLELSFVLDRGCYATSFIREIIRTNPLNYT
ncbi:MAG: tRNA pseudouridine(13) synthase TruD [Ignisphaera sp.]